MENGLQVTLRFGYAEDRMLVTIPRDDLEKLQSSIG